MEKANQQISILIADGHQMLREGLIRLLNIEPDFRVVADTGDAGQVLDLASQLKPDLLLIDLSNLHPSSEMEILQKLSTTSPNLHIVLLTSSVDTSRIVEVLKYGVHGVVLKKADSTLLFKCIRTVMAGSYWISRDATDELVKSFAMQATMQKNPSTRGNHYFSDRQLKILQSVVFGYTNKEIAKELHLSEQAIKYHLTNLFRKTGVFGRMQLARYTMDRQLLLNVDEKP